MGHEQRIRVIYSFIKRALDWHHPPYKDCLKQLDNLPLNHFMLLKFKTPAAYISIVYSPVIGDGEYAHIHSHLFWYLPLVV